MGCPPPTFLVPWYLFPPPPCVYFSSFPLLTIGARGGHAPHPRLQILGQNIQKYPLYCGQSSQIYSHKWIWRSCRPLPMVCLYLMRVKISCMYTQVTKTPFALKCKTYCFVPTRSILSANIEKNISIPNCKWIHYNNNELLILIWQWKCWYFVLEM
jgi:hypothetical protein